MLTRTGAVEDRAFLLVVFAVSLAFLWILWPYSGAILWGMVLAIIFAPLYRRLSSTVGKRRTLAALATELIIVVIVILPVAMIAASLVREGSRLYQRISSGELDVGRYFQQAFDALPAWGIGLLDRFGLGDLASVQQRLSGMLTSGLQFLATQALNIGQYALSVGISLFVMLYLLFFLLRDGDDLARRIRQAIPLHPEHQRTLLDRFVVVVRATVKGNLVVAVVQGALGGLIFWILGLSAPVSWGVLMALLSLLPAVGAPMIWLPAAMYLLLTGQTWRGAVLLVSGFLVIGLVDNLLRPILVGKDTKLPDYIVLISTLGGLAVFGANGFVIGPLIAATFIAVWDSFAAVRTGGPIHGGEADLRDR